jgi:hypothetical protein
VGPGELLWNHKLSTATSYGVYSSPSFNSLGTDISDLSNTNVAGSLNSSNLCLSCHDGTVAVNSFYEGVTGANFQPIPEDTTFIHSAAQVRDMTKQHPVNFTWTAAISNTKNLIVPASTAGVDANGWIPLENGKMQCATCHDPHRGSGIMTRPFPTQASGTFCTYCHL